MNKKEYFILGCKLLGVYCIFLSLPYFISAISTFFTQNDGGEYGKYLYLMTVTTRAIPIIYLFFGIYLLKNGSLIHNYAYPDTDEIEEHDGLNIHDKFTLFLKFLGVYIIVTSFPDLLQAITSYFTYTNAPEVFMFTEQRQFTYINFLPSIVGIAIGFYLLKSGKFFVQIGLDQKKEDVSDSE